MGQRSGEAPHYARLNRVYANILNKPILVPKADPTSLGSAVFAFLDAGTLYRKLYFAMGSKDAPPAAIGNVLPELRRISRKE